MRQYLDFMRQVYEHGLERTDSSIGRRITQLTAVPAPYTNYRQKEPKADSMADGVTGVSGDAAATTAGSDGDGDGDGDPDSDRRPSIRNTPPYHCTHLLQPLNLAPVTRLDVPQKKPSSKASSSRKSPRRKPRPPNDWMRFVVTLLTFALVVYLIERNLHTLAESALSGPLLAAIYILSRR
jgi:hypothetical protein